MGDDDHIRLLAKNGRFQLNMEIIDEKDLETRKLKDGDLFSSKEHRHEPPIIGQQPTIIHEDEKFYVVDKPSSYPIHPVSQYRHNSLIFILAREFKADYHVVHRLDRLTSGLVIMAKTKTQSQILGQQITKRQLTKVRFNYTVMLRNRLQIIRNYWNHILKRILGVYMSCRWKVSRTFRSE